MRNCMKLQLIADEEFTEKLPSWMNFADSPRPLQFYYPTIDNGYREKEFKTALGGIIPIMVQIDALVQFHNEMDFVA